MIDFRSTLGITTCLDFGSEGVDPLLTVGRHADGLASVRAGSLKNPGEGGGV